jgi:hypothetical protein
MKIIIITITAAALSLGFFAMAAPPQTVQAQANLACDGLSPDVAGGNCTTPADASEPNVNTTLASVINLLSIVAGIIAVIMIIIAGVKFMTSGGDAGKVASARSSVIYAIIGLVIVVLSQTFVFFVVDRS